MPSEKSNEKPIDNENENKIERKKKRFNKKELEFYKKLLLEIREKIAGELDHIKEDSLRKTQKDNSGDLSGYSLHMADAASDNYEMDFRLGLASNEQNILHEIEEALKRIEEGTYGWCEKYGTPIPEERLNAMPYARYSIKAQEEEEENRR